MAHFSRLPQLCHETGAGTNADWDADVLGVDGVVVAGRVVLGRTSDVPTSPASVVQAVPSATAELSDTNSKTARRAGTERS